jgi:hypothetical protein
MTDGFDFNTSERVAHWEALLQQLIECLRWYEGYLIGFAEDDENIPVCEGGCPERGAALRQDAKKAAAFREELENWFPTSRPPGKKLSSGLRIHDGDAPPLVRPPWAELWNMTVARAHRDEHRAPRHEAKARATQATRTEQSDIC